jgi:alkylated DNA repair dioxygenase AlkB
MGSRSSASSLPQGFAYHPDWITTDEEHTLLLHAEQLPFSEVRMHGVVAKRKVVHFGWNYGYDSWTISPTEPIPEWLMPVTTRAAGVMGVSPETVQEVLVTRYPPGAGIGWHRDAPMFGPVVLGLSMAGRCRMRFQRMVAGERWTAEAVLSPRSSYLLTGDARFVWQHSIPPTKELRYSITFRTLKKGQPAGAEGLRADSAPMIGR